eukprot:s3080_g14.t1
MVLSLDMSHAFDSVPRQYLQAALLDAGVARADVQLIMQWLQGSEYHLQHGRINLSILTHRGVRQGCVLSPLLWSCFTCYVAKRLPQTLRKQDLQMYADDFLMYWIFRSRADFHLALSSIPVFLAALRAFGLTINLSKTAALIRMAHPQGQVELRKHVVSNHKGTFLSLFGPQTELVPLVKQHKYLGCIISLFDFEVLTIRHRIEVGRNQFSRLRKILTLPWCAELMAVVEQTEAEKEVTSLFAAYLPSLAVSAPGNKRQVPQARRDPPKHRRPEYKGKHGTQDKGKGRGNRGPTTSGPGSSSNQPPVPNMNDEEGVKEILRMLMQAEHVPESEGTRSEQLVPEDDEDQASEVQAAQPGLCGGALRSDILHFLRRRPSQALDDGQLALYLQFRGVSFDTVMDWGVYFYLEQHQHDSDDQRRELLHQLHAMLGKRDIFDALCFYRYMLEGQVRDEFYAELYNQIASRIQHHPRPAFFADALRALSQQRDDAEDTDDACPDTKPADTASTTTAACFASCSRMDVPPISQETRPGSHRTHMSRRAELDLVCMPWFCQVA